MKTLEAFHEPLTDAFPRLAADSSRYELSDDQVGEWRERGYVARIPVLGPAEVEALRARLDALMADLESYRPHLYEIEADHLRRPAEVVLHFLGAWRVDELFHDLLFHPALTVPTAQLLGVERVRFWHDQVFAKPPRHAGIVPWHQDYSYWQRTAPAHHLTINLVLDDTTPQSGCLHVIPGSHEWPLLPSVAFGGAMDAILPSLTEHQRAVFEPTPIPLRAGEASIHHSHTIHGSFANASDRPRRAVVVNFMGPDVRVAHDDVPLLAPVPIIPRGSVVEGPFFPIVLDLDS